MEILHRGHLSIRSIRRSSPIAGGSVRAVQAGSPTSGCGAGSDGPCQPLACRSCPDRLFLTGARLDRDPPRARGLFLRKDDAQDTVLELRGRVVSVGGDRERNAATVGTTGQRASVPRDLLRLIFTRRVADR